MEIKISYEDYAYIRGYKKKHPFEKVLYNFRISGKYDYPNWSVTRTIKRWMFVLLFIPINLINILLTIAYALRDIDWVTLSSCDSFDGIYIHPPERYKDASGRLVDVLKQHGVMIDEQFEYLYTNKN